MKTIVIDAAHCPNCGKPTPAAALAGLCPACLLAQGAASESGDGGRGGRFVPPPLEEIAKLFPQLEILSLLGAGGMGAVYQARQPALDRVVALKILPAKAEGGANFEERFNREARALARLNHPNIVAVFEFGQVGGAGGLHFFIMEFVDGANLRQLEQAGRLAPREALQIIPQICDALQYAHDEGVVHRDIKPENVLVDRKGRVKIADFGLAKILGQDAEALRLTAEGQVMGTPHYMAPEQIEKPLTVDHRADIYSLGVVLYEMLTGDLPLGKFAPPSRKYQLDVRLDDVVLRALENDPARRYQRVSEVKSQMETIAGQPTASPGSSRREEAPSDSAPAKSPQKRLLHWAGFPVVTEFGDEREVNWNGTLSALAAAFFCLFLGFVAVRFVSGRSDVPGTRPVCVAMAVLVVLAGVRRTMNQPWESELPHTPKGTAILTPRRRLFHGRLALLAIPLFVVAWSLFILHWLQPALRKQSGVPLIVARMDTATGILRADVPGRGVLELLGVAETNAAPNQWWRPDGRVATNANYELHSLVQSSSDTGQHRVFVLRAHDLPDGADGPFLASAEPGATMSSGGTVFSHGKRLAGGRPMVLALREPRRFTAIRAGLALESRRKVFSFDPTTRHTEHFKQPGDPHWNIAMHGATDTPNGAQVSTVMSQSSTDWQVEIVVVDQTGKERTQRLVTGSGLPSGGGLMVYTHSFPGLPLKDVKEFRALARRVQWFEFPGVVLDPKGNLPEAKPLRLTKPLWTSWREGIASQAAPQRQADQPRVDSWIDLDSDRSESFSGKPAEIEAQAKRSGCDVAINADKFISLDTTFALVPDAAFAEFTPQQIIDSVYRGRFAPRELKPVKADGTGVTFTYETREGGFGILQLTRTATGSWPDGFRYKRVER